jgi:hypothetical protein
VTRLSLTPTVPGVPPPLCQNVLHPNVYIFAKTPRRFGKLISLVALLVHLVGMAIGSSNPYRRYTPATTR